MLRPAVDPALEAYGGAYCVDGVAHDLEDVRPGATADARRLWDVTADLLAPVVRRGPFARRGPTTPHA